MKVLVTGASGLLGRAVFAELSDYECTGTVFSSAEQKGLIKLDLTDSTKVSLVLNNLNPDIVIHCAAERRPDVVDNNPEAALELNVSATHHLAKLCFEKNIYLCYISTDYVFDGKKQNYNPLDECNPLNEYGKMKRQGEVHVLDFNHCVLRVPVLYGNVLKNSDSAINILLDPLINSSVSADDSQIRYPTLVEDVAKVIKQICVKKPKGIFQFSAKEPWTKFKITQLFAKLLNKQCEIKPCSLVQTNRPGHIKMSTEALEQMGINIKPTDFVNWWTNKLKN